MTTIQTGELTDDSTMNRYFAFIIPILLPAILLTMAIPLAAQNSTDFVPVDIDTRLHPDNSLDFYLLDNSGRPVRDLLINDFVLTEDGTRRPITAFSCPPDGPTSALSSLLVIDVSASMQNAGKLDVARRAAGAWLERLPLGYSEGAIIAFNHEAELLQDFTTNRDLLNEAVERLVPSGGTSYDAALLSLPFGAIPIVSRAEHRPVIIFLTDGLSEVDVEGVITGANSAGAELHVVVLGIDAPESLRRIASGTGGFVFDNVDEIGDAEQIFRLILLAASGTEPCRLRWNGGGECATERVISIDVPYHGAAWTDVIPIPVERTPRLIPEGMELAFGPRDPGAAIEKRLILRAGQNPVVISAATFQEGPFKLISSIPPLPAQIEAGGTAEFTIAFTPKDSTWTTSRLDFVSSACDLPPILCTGGYPGITSGSKFRIVHPNGGEVFAVGSAVKIEWEGIDPGDTVQIEFSRDGGGEWTEITAEATGGSWIWNPPDIPGDAYLVRGNVLTANGLRGVVRLPGTDRIWSVAFSSVGEIIATGSQSGVVRFWDGASGDQILEEIDLGRSTTIRHLDFSPDGRLLVINTTGTTLHWRSMVDGSFGTRTLNSPIDVSSYTSDGGRIVSAGGEGELMVQDGVTLDPITTYGPDLFGTTRSLRTASSADLVLVGGDDLTPRMFRLSDGTLVATLKKHAAPVQGVDVAEDGSWMLTAGLDGELRIYNGSITTPTFEYSTGVGILAARFAPDFTTVVHGGFEGSGTGRYPVSLLGMTDRGIDRELRGHKGVVTSVDFNGRGDRLVSGSWDSSAILWHLPMVPDGVDRSDGPFSIVAPTISIGSVDMGELLIGEVRDSLVRGMICNSGRHQVEIDSIRVFPSIFALRSDPGPLVLAPGECIDVELSFAPDRSGTAEGSIDLHSGTKIFTAELEGIGRWGIHTDFGRVIDFGQVSIGTSVDSLVALEFSECGIKTGTIVEQISLVGSGDTNFSISDSGPGSTGPLESYPVGIEFSPIRRGLMTAEVLLDCWCEENPGRSERVRVRLIGEGICPEPSPEAVAMIPGDLTGEVGDHLTIPVLLQPNAPRPGTPVRFQLLLSYDPTVVALVDRSSMSLKTGKTSTLIIEGDWDGPSDTLTTFDVTVGLGGAVASEIRFDRLVFENDCSDEFHRESGLLTIDGLCPDPEIRLFMQTDSIYLRGVSPDPVRSVSTVSWRLIEEGRMRLVVVNLRGDVVRTIQEGELPPGEYSAELESGSIPAGTYFLRLQTPTRDIIRRFVAE